MDEEARKVSEMSPAELEARHAASEPAQIRKREDFSQRMHVMEETIARSESGDTDITEFEYVYDARSHAVVVDRAVKPEGVLLKTP